MKRVLIVIDKYGWSYDTIARGIVEHNADPGMAFSIASAAEDLAWIEREHLGFDLVFVLGWTSLFSNKAKHGYRDLLPFLDRRRVVTGIHSHRSWDGYASTPDHSPDPPAWMIDRLRQVRGVNAISRRLFQCFESAGLDNLSLTENGVDTTLFTPRGPVGGTRERPLVVGFAGSTAIAKHDDLKGFSELIEPLGRLRNVEVRALGGRGANQVPRVGMPALYNGIDLYVCASASEGFSQSVLEASACGRAVVSTRVGGCEDLIDEGANGHLVERHADAIATVVERLEREREQLPRLGARNREIVCERYAWQVRVRDWLDFVRLHLGDATP